MLDDNKYLQICMYIQCLFPTFKLKCIFVLSNNLPELNMSLCIYASLLIHNTPIHNINQFSFKPIQPFNLSFEEHHFRTTQLAPNIHAHTDTHMKNQTHLLTVMTKTNKVKY